MSILGSAKDFRGLNGLTYNDLNELSCEIRKIILQVTLKKGGHLASSLGAVELTIALLREFDPDRDKIIFDVGHQSYAYKILTKRLDRFHTLRTKGGIAGFPRMDESPYDFFTTGHSSTSISAAQFASKALAYSITLFFPDYPIFFQIPDSALPVSLFGKWTRKKMLPAFLDFLSQKRIK